jgi:hypothetical protein
MKEVKNNYNVKFLKLFFSIFNETTFVLYPAIGALTKWDLVIMRIKIRINMPIKLIWLLEF